MEHGNDSDSFNDDISNSTFRVYLLYSELIVDIYKFLTDIKLNL